MVPLRKIIGPDSVADSLGGKRRQRPGPLDINEIRPPSFPNAWFSMSSFSDLFSWVCGAVAPRIPSISKTLRSKDANATMAPDHSAWL